MTKQLSGVLHIRAVDLSGVNKMSGNDYKLRAESGITLAYAVEQNGDVDVGIAVCSHEDRFDRKLGAKIATGRLLAERDVNMRQKLDSSALAFASKEFLGVEAYPQPVQGKGGEWFVHESQFPLVKLLLTLAKSVAVDILYSELHKLKLNLRNPVGAENVSIVRFGNAYAFHFEPELEIGTLVV